MKGRRGGKQGNTRRIKNASRVKRFGEGGRKWDKKGMKEGVTRKGMSSNYGRERKAVGKENKEMREDLRIPAELRILVIEEAG